jgi:hypothetical protein
MHSVVLQFWVYLSLRSETHQQVYTVGRAGLNTGLIYSLDDSWIHYR